MANFINNGAHNWTGAVWGATDATCLQVAVSSNTNTTTSMVYSTAQACDGVLDIDGLLLHCKQTTVTGTVSVSLNNSVSDQQTVTVNATDLPTNPSWVFFKFASPVTVSAVGVWRIGVTGSSAGNATFYRDGTAGNWAHIIRKTTQGTPANTDNVYIAGERTAAATYTARTVTMQNTSAANTTDIAIFNVCDLGTLAYGTSASTAYHLGFTGAPRLWPNGTMTMGTSGTPMPSTSTASLEFITNSTTFLVDNDATFYAYGNTLTYVKAMLTADVSAAGTGLTTDVSTGWASGDNIALHTTSATVTQSEAKVMSAPASGTSVTVAAVTNAHSGTSPTQCMIMNLTRNVTIRGFNSSSSTQVFQVRDGSTVTLSYVDTNFLGSGVQLLTSGTGSGTAHTLTGVAFHDATQSTGYGLLVSSYASGKTLTVTDMSAYNIYGSALSTTGSAHAGTMAFNGVWCTKGTGSTTFVNITHTCIAAHTFNNVWVSGVNTNGVTIYAGNSPYTILGTFSNFTQHSCGGGISITGMSTDLTMSNVTVWRSISGIAIASGATLGLTINTGSFFGNTTAGINVSSGGLTSNVTLNNCTFNKGVTTLQTVGIQVNGQCSATNWQLNNCSFGATTAHSTADIVGSAGSGIVNMVLRNTVLASGTEITTNATSTLSSILQENYDGTANSHKSLFLYGTVTNDTTIYNTASPSERLTPSNASNKLKSGLKMRGADSATTYTVTCKVRTSVVGDGAANNGNRARLRQMAEPAGGIASDVTIATASVASDGAWETLTGTTTAINFNGRIRFYIDCDGTTGWINVDDWTIT